MLIALTQAGGGAQNYGKRADIILERSRMYNMYFVTELERQYKESELKIVMFQTKAL